MKNSAFTLIEMLIVVLVIGILAAIALPQYQLAVDKTRAAEALSNLRVLKTAVDSYLLIYSGNPSDFSKLDVAIGSGCGAANCVHGKFTYRFTTNPSGAVVAYATTGDASGVPYIGFVFDDTKSFCNAKKGDFVCQDRGQARWTKICKALGGVSRGSVDGGTCYALR